MAPLARLKGLYHGWTVLAVTVFCSALSSPGQSFLLSLYVEPMAESLGQSRLAISSLYGSATLAAALCLPLVGRLADRVPTRQYLAGILLVLSAVFVGVSRVNSIAALAVSFFLLRLLGQGAIGLGAMTTVVRWFERFRGRALAISALGFSFGEMVFPALTLWLMVHVGWRGSWLAYAAGYALVAAPLVWWLARERRVDEPLDGVVPMVPEHGRTARPHVSAPSVPLTVALRMPMFWHALAGVAVAPLVATGLLFHQVGLFAWRGWPPALAASAFFTFAVGGVVGTTVTGFWVERRPVRWALAIAYLLFASAPVCLWMPDATTAATAYGAWLGLGSGAMASANSAFWPTYFGTAALGSIKGVVGAVRNGATAIGPPLVAALALGASGFGRPVVVLAALSLVGAGMVALLPPPSRLTPSDRASEAGD